MRIAFLGKGGSGKTTLAAAFTKYISTQTPEVLAIDADVNMHMHQLLDIPAPEYAVGDHFNDITNRLFHKRNTAGTPIPQLGCIPPSLDSEFIYYEEDDPIIKKYVTHKDNIGLLQVGTYNESEIGAWCFHGRLLVLELILHYLLEPSDMPIVIDQNAGSDAVATSLYFAAETYIFVVEPTLKSINVYKDYQKLVNELVRQKDIVLKVVVNKTYTEEDKAFVQEHIPAEDILGYIPFDSRIGHEGKDSIDSFVKKHESILSSIKQVATPASQRSTRYLAMVQELFEKKINNREISTHFIDPQFSYEKVRLKTDDYFSRCYLNPINKYKKRVFEQLMSNITGDVFEIGAGEVPWYWAMGYIDNVQSVVFSEYSKKRLENYKNLIANIDIPDLSEKIGSTLAFLKEKNIISQDTYLEDLFEKILLKSTTMQFDFLRPISLEREFDTVIGFEAIGLVDSQEELRQAFKTIHQLLKPNGKFVGTTCPYREKDHFVERLIKNKLEGNLVLKREMIEIAAQEVGFTSITVEEMLTGKKTYPITYFMTFKK